MNAKRLQNVHILIVDDGDDNRLLLRHLLSDEGAAVSEACDGTEGVQKALDNQYDVILMDIQMPGMDGYESVRRLRELSYKGPVVALTAHAMNEERELSLSSGFTDHVTKPIQRDMLVNSILKYASV